MKNVSQKKLINDSAKSRKVKETQDEEDQKVLLEKPTYL